MAMGGLENSSCKGMDWIERERLSCKGMDWIGAVLEA